MPVTLNDFKAFVDSGANGNVRLFRGDDSKLVEYGRTGFWKIFSSGYWNEKATNQENVAIRKAFVKALENSNEFSSEHLESIKKKLGVGAIQDDGIAMSDLTVEEVRYFIEGISFEDVQSKLKQFFIPKYNNHESAVTAIEKELKSLARQKGAKENELEKTLFSDSEIATLKEKIKNTLKVRFHNYNQRLTIPIEQLEMMKKWGIPLSIYQCDGYKLENARNGLISRAIKGEAGIEAFDTLIDTINLNLLFVEADATLYGNEETRKESLRFHIEEWMSKNIAKYNNIPQKEREFAQ